MIPAYIKQVSETELRIKWDDNHYGKHSLGTLRKLCPCASCKQGVAKNEHMVLLPILQPGQNKLSAIEQIGNYALQLKWGDGHKTGIYSFDYLRGICECDSCSKLTLK
ncbi:MAG: gamma-butyrobetaine hydroxylase-like domain-containing protein [Bacteroidota bacterium]